MSQSNGGGAAGEAPAPTPRFFKSVDTARRAEGVAVLLDGRPVKTPARAALALPSQALAERVAAEWDAQAEVIRPETMPLTRLANSCIDGVAPNAAAVAEDIVRFAGTDLVCYRADGPEELVRRQAAAWDPLIAFAQKALGHRFVLAEGVMPVTQGEALLAAFRAALPGDDPFRLGALHVVTSLTGSAVIALALHRGERTLEEAWSAAHVDEDWNILLWGEDAEAKARRDRRRAEAEAADTVLRLA